MKLPFEIIAGKWVAFKGNYPKGQDIQHRIILIHITESEFKYFYVTSKIDKVMRVSRKDIDSIVELEPIEWIKLDRKSCIQCNKGHLNTITKEDLEKDYSTGQSEYLEMVPKKVIEKIINAIQSSITFTAKEKEEYSMS